MNERNIIKENEEIILMKTRLINSYRIFMKQPELNTKKKEKRTDVNRTKSKQRK